MTTPQDKNLQTQTAPANDIEAYIMQAITANAPIDTLEKLLNMREKFRLEMAKKDFDQAFANFQSECPVIVKDKIVMNKDGRSERYRYAPLDSIISQIKVPLAKHGFSYSITSEITADGWIQATAKLSHLGGHSETSTFKVPIDKEGYMNAQQLVASAQTYAKRYAFCNVTGIMTGDEDDDSNQNLPKTEKKETQKETPNRNLTGFAKQETPNSIRCFITENVRVSSGVTGEVKDKDGNITKKGRPWILHSVEIDKNKYGTFDTKIGEKIMQAWDGKIEVIISYEEEKRGRKITNIVFASTGETNEPHSDTGTSVPA